jgi:hypothetical protein
MLAVFVCILIIVPGQLRHDIEDARGLHQSEAEFRSAIQLVKSRPGPALCESLLLCYQAGKPFGYDAFFVLDQIQIGRLKEEEVAQLIRTHYFQTIQVNIPGEQANWPTELVEPQRFTQTFMRELGEHYLAAMRTSQFILFVPK